MKIFMSYAFDDEQIMTELKKALESHGIDVYVAAHDVNPGKHLDKKIELADVANSVQQASDGGYIVAGYTDSFGAGQLDFWLVKADSSGNMQWSRTYGGTHSDFASSVQEISDGGYIVAGVTTSFGAGGYDFWLVKEDAIPTLGIVLEALVVAVAALFVIIGVASFLNRKKRLSGAHS